MTVTPPVGNRPAPPELELEDRVRILGDIAQARIAGSTPARFRMWSLAVVIAIVVAALANWWAAGQLVDSGDRAEQNTAPVLVAVQDVFASIAEADAASAAVFLSGADGDREQRRLYEVALERATGQLEEVARLVGDDEVAHESIKEISADLVRYAGLVEAARLATVNSLPGADSDLLSAIDIVQDGIVPEVQALTARAQADLDDDVDSGTIATAIALAWSAVVVVLLLAAQAHLRARTNRLIAPAVALATLLILTTGIWMAAAWIARQADLDDARDGGYDSIALTADIQTSAFRYKTLESLALLGAGDIAEQDTLATRLAAVPIDDEVIADARTGDAVGAGLLLEANRRADSAREQAATTELLVRWDRYRATSDEIRFAVDRNQDDAAVALATGPGNSDFNGVNTAVESVLSDNRSQFLDGVATARNRLDRLRLAGVLLPAIAALLTLWGFQRRIREYYR